MKTWILIVASCLAALWFAAPAVAQEDPADRTDRLFERYDADGDGVLTEEEWRRGERVRSGRPDPEERLREMDTNEDGSITREEWTGPEMVFDRFDRDGDGVISEEEMEEMKKRRGGEGPGGPRDRERREPGGGPEEDDD